MSSDAIPRNQFRKRLETALANFPAVAVLGPRQCGKTWLTRPLASKPENYFALDNFIDRARIEETNFRALDALEDIVVIDEAQEMPQLFSKIRNLVDRIDNRTKFILTGSSSPNINKGISESLAGRVRRLNLSGFNAEEVGWSNWERLWLTGSYPRSYKHQILENSFQWRVEYISDFISRDLGRLVDSRLNEGQIRKLMQLLAHGHGQFWKHAEAGRDIGVTYHTVQKYIEILKGAFIVRELQPYHVNIRKRVRKAPRLYFRDSGLLHALLPVRENYQLQQHPKYGASWEGFCIEHIIHFTNTRDEECFYWSVQGGEEVDLVLDKPKGRFGFEFKASDAPRKTKSMLSASESLNLDHLYVIYPGDREYSLSDSITALPFCDLKKTEELSQ